MNPLQSFHVVLVETEESRNIGSVARAMANLGFLHLHLVAPVGYSRARANVTACNAKNILDDAVFHDCLEDALAEVEEAVALSGRPPKEQAHYLTLPEWSGALTSRPLPKTALVFGPEDNGLRQEHLEMCRYVLRIPARSEQPSFNVAQAALLALYEITKAFPPDAPPPAPAPNLPTQNDYFQLNRLVQSVMEESGFVRRGTPEPMPGRIRGLLSRLALNRDEMATVLGLFGRLHRTLLRKKD